MSARERQPGRPPAGSKPAPGSKPPGRSKARPARPTSDRTTGNSPTRPAMSIMPPKPRNASLASLSLLDRLPFHRHAVAGRYGEGGPAIACLIPVVNPNVGSLLRARRASQCGTCWRGVFGTGGWRGVLGDVVLIAQRFPNARRGAAISALWRGPCPSRGQAGGGRRHRRANPSSPAGAAAV